MRLEHKGRMATMMMMRTESGIMASRGNDNMVGFVVGARNFFIFTPERLKLSREKISREKRERRLPIYPWEYFIANIDASCMRLSITGGSAINILDRMDLM